MPDASLPTTWRGTVLPQWVDYNGHLNDAYYMVVFSQATDALMAMIGLDEAGRKATGHTIYTLEAHVSYLLEVGQGQAIEVRTQVLGSDAKRLQIWQGMFLAGTDTLLAANEQMLLNIDTANGPRAAPFAPMVAAQVQVLALAHRQLARPEHAGRRVGGHKSFLAPDVAMQDLTPSLAHGLTTPLEGTGHRPWDAAAPIAAPLCLLETTVRRQWVDYNGHMSESCYLLVFGDNSDAFFRFIGIDEAYRAAGHSLYTVQTQLHNLREVSEGEPIRLTLQLLDCDAKRLHLFHAMFHGASGALLATGEQLLVHVDMQAGRSVPMPDDMAAKVQAIRAAHAGLPQPAQAGQPIGIRRKPA